MATSRKDAPEPKRQRPPATTPQARENQLIALSYDLAEKQLRDGTASSQVMTQFLKLGSSREYLEKERLAMSIELDRAKAEAMAAGKQTEEQYKNALNAMRAYQGQDVEMPDDVY